MLGCCTWQDSRSLCGDLDSRVVLQFMYVWIAVGRRCMPSVVGPRGFQAQQPSNGFQMCEGTDHQSACTKVDSYARS